MAVQPRAEMHASPEQFGGGVEFAGWSYRGLAEEVTRELRKEKSRPRIGCSHTTLLNLANGSTRWIHPRRAAAIERCLKLPPGHLFRIELFNVPSDKRTA